jgi:hypothetical protein
MALITLVSAKSRGVTTSALAMTLAHPRPTLLAECDPSGASIRWGFLGGRAPVRQRPDGGSEEVGLAGLAVADRQDALAEAFEENLVRLDGDGDRQLLPGPSDPRYASALSGTWESLAQLLTVMDQAAGYDVIVDGGRLVLDAGRVHAQLYPAPLLHRADVVLLVVRSTYSSLEQARPVAAALREELAARGGDADGRGAEALGLLVVNEGSYPSHEIAQYLQAPVLGLLAWDPAVAGYLSDGGRMPRGFVKSTLMRSARTAADNVEEVTQRRRVQLQWGGTPRPSSPVVAGVVERLRHERGVAARA